MIEQKYELANKFEEERASVMLERKYMYIDTAGKEVTEAVYDDALEFRNGLASVRKGSESGYIDRSGKTIWS